MPNILDRFLLRSGAPISTFILQNLLYNFRWGSFRRRQAIGAVRYPQYAYCMYQAAVLARRLGITKISAVEFGVAGGNGLLTMEEHAHNIRSETGVEFELYGFDMGCGLPASCDNRDLPYRWNAGFYRMEQAELRATLRSARLILGPVRETIETFFDLAPAPIGAIAFDLDYYTSTRDAFRLFEGQSKSFLPRVLCYFDDIIDSNDDLYGEVTPEYYNDFSGERLAIREFNRDHPDRKIAQRYLAPGRYIKTPWQSKVLTYHDFLHPDYCRFISHADEQVPIRRARHLRFDFP